MDKEGVESDMSIRKVDAKERQKRVRNAYCRSGAIATFFTRASRTAMGAQNGCSTKARRRQTACLTPAMC
ncbi:hypothetical protein GCM10025858_11240 [Alicyclobacillus sacchari]|nr:hypothetical protein GCM10025858_11240 [Alicyclobacillus sacchari]